MKLFDPNPDDGPKWGDGGPTGPLGEGIRPDGIGIRLTTEIMHHRGGLPAPPDPPGPRASGPGDETGRDNEDRAGGPGRAGPAGRGGQSGPILIIPSSPVPWAGGLGSRGSGGAGSPPPPVVHNFGRQPYGC